MIYLDNNASTVPDAHMLSAVVEEVTRYYGNPSSPHFFGSSARDYIELSRAYVAQMLGAHDNQIIFTSGGTEANYLALHDKMFVCSNVEHSSIFNMSTPNLMCRVSPDGLLDLNELEILIKQWRKSWQFTVSVMYANNETGVILDPLFKIKELKKQYGFIYHIDAVQGVGKGPNLNVDALGADLLTISGHKFHGLKGAGALYVRNPALVIPIFKGGSHELGLRPGTENQAGILSLGYMCNKLNNDEFYNSRISKIKELRDKLENDLSDIATVNGNLGHRVVNTSSMSIDSITDLDLFLEILSDMGLSVSGKSACATGLPTPSRTLKAMYGANDARLNNTLRLSLSVNTTATELEIAQNIIREARSKFLKEIGE